MKTKIVKTVSVILCAVVVLSVVAGVAAFAHWQNSDEYVAYDPARLQAVYGSATFLDCDGQVLCESTTYGQKKQIPLAALPEYVYMAFVSVEDKRFFTHGGVDLLRVGAAALHNFTSGSKKEGASTITQQLVKNTHLTGDKTYKRKINEMLLARELERNYSKQEILEMYLNTIYFGRNAYGVETAANVYFGKSAADLTVGQAAILAGMIKAPNVYAPDKDVDKCRTRRNLVLDIMHKQGIIDEQTLVSAQDESIECCPRTGCDIKGYTYFALKEAASLLNMSERQVMQGGFVIETYCRSELQKAFSEIVEKDVTRQTDETLANMCLATCDKNGGVSACCIRGEGFVKRQVGSTLKPIAVYTPAFCEKQICPASPILDEKTDFNGYCPTNAGGYKGWTTVTNAVLSSSNVGAVKTLNALTLPIAQRYMSALGYDGKQDLSLALGNVDGGMDERDLLHCYTALCNCGTASKTRFVKSISNAYGQLYTADSKSTQIYDKASAYLMTDLLVKNTRIGTAKKLKCNGMQVAAKTGTVGNKSGNTDAFTVAYTSGDVFVAHYYGLLPNGVSGGNAPCLTLGQALAASYKQHSPDKFVCPNNVHYVAIDEQELFARQRITRSDNGTLYPFVDGGNFVQTKEQLGL